MIWFSPCLTLSVDENRPVDDSVVVAANTFLIGLPLTMEFCLLRTAILCMKGAICCVDSFSKACWTNPTAWTTCCLNCDQMVLKIDCATHPFLSCPECALHVLSRILLTIFWWSLCLISPHFEVSNHCELPMF